MRATNKLVMAVRHLSYKGRLNWTIKVNHRYKRGDTFDFEVDKIQVKYNNNVKLHLKWQKTA